MDNPFPPPHQNPPAGWYNDPSGQMRWWDGQQWGVFAPAQSSGGGADEKGMATLAHALAIFTGFLGPLVIYLMARDDQPFVKHHAAESLNFQITVLLAVIVSFVLIFVLIGIVLLPLVGLGALILEIMAAVNANRGDWYRYPINLRLVSGARG